MLHEKKKSSAKQATALGLVLCGTVVFALGAWRKLSAPMDATNAVEEVVAGYTIIRGLMDRAQAKAECDAAGLVLASLDSESARNAIDVARRGAEHFWLDGIRDGNGVLAWESGKAFDGALGAANVIRDEPGQGQDCGAFYMNGAGIHNGFESMVCAEVHDGALCEGGAPVPPPPCTAAALDVIFVFDASGSIGAAGYQEELDWSSSMVDALVKDSDRVAFLRFASSSTLSLSLANSVGMTTDQRKALLQGIAYTGGGTATAGALNMAIAELNGSELSRGKIMFLLTDGIPNSQLCPTTSGGFDYKADMDSKNIESLLVGIGNFDVQQVECLADSANTFVVADLSEAEAEALLNDIFGVIKC